MVGGSFGFHELMEKLGIERRLYTSGERKAMLDPFLPEKPEDVERLKAMQREIHASFIELVKARRGAPRRRRDGCSPANSGPAARLVSSASPTPRRHALGAARALRRQGADAADGAAERPLFGLLGRRPSICWSSLATVAAWPTI